jgi:hypothetical protein
MGSLTFFTEKNAPQGCAQYCTDCKVENCIYRAKDVYQEWKWMRAYFCNDVENDELANEKLRYSQYDKCVFHTDNNVVDHQRVNMTFENGVKATLTMTGFSSTTGRVISFFGTQGELVLDETEECIKIRSFNAPEEKIMLETLNEQGYGHGGGDFGLINTLYSILSGEESCRTSLDSSIESHLMGICAEESRKKGGELVYIRKQA